MFFNPALSTVHSSPSLLSSAQLCGQWEHGRCMKGASCKYLHLSPQTLAATANTAHLSSSSDSPYHDSEALVGELEEFHLDGKLSATWSDTYSTGATAGNKFGYLTSSGTGAGDGSDSEYTIQPMNFMSVTTPSPSSLANLTLSLSPAHHPIPGHPHPHHSARKDCWDWLAGRCNRGSMCKFNHSNHSGHTMKHSQSASSLTGSSGDSAVCHQWVRGGHCQYGDQCKFAHLSTPYNQHQHPSNHYHNYNYSGDGDATNPFHFDTFQPSPQPSVLFRDSRLGLDTEVCRFYAKNSRCKYGMACKFVHVNHGNSGQRGIIVNGINVTVSELQRLCALHGLTPFTMKSSAMNEAFANNPGEAPLSVRQSPHNHMFNSAANYVHYHRENYLSQSQATTVRSSVIDSDPPMRYVSDVSDLLDDDSQFLNGSTQAALSGSGLLAQSHTQSSSSLASSLSSTSLPSLCDHCHSNASVYGDAQTSLCEACYTQFFR